VARPIGYQNIRNTAEISVYMYCIRFYMLVSLSSCQHHKNPKLIEWVGCRVNWNWTVFRAECRDTGVCLITCVDVGCHASHAACSHAPAPPPSLQPSIQGATESIP